jgi:pimeloyl-ACP methyl ester carboxylesterase
MQMTIEYEIFALTRHVDKAQKPYAMSKSELNQVKAPVYLIVGEKDLLFPYQNTVKAAEERLKNLKKVVVLPGVGHGVETLRGAMEAIVNC